MAARSFRSTAKLQQLPAFSASPAHPMPGTQLPSTTYSTSSHRTQAPFPPAKAQTHQHPPKHTPAKRRQPDFVVHDLELYFLLSIKNSKWQDQLGLKIQNPSEVICLSRPHLRHPVEFHSSHRLPFDFDVPVRKCPSMSGARVVLWL